MWRGAFTQVRMCLHGADVKRSAFTQVKRVPSVSASVCTYS